MTHEHHHHDQEGTLSLQEKLIKRIEHWLKHNTDHAETYQEWSENLAREDFHEAAEMLGRAAAESLRINEYFERALKSIRSKTS
jgi:hypothetical protein